MIRIYNVCKAEQILFQQDKYKYIVRLNTLAVMAKLSKKFCFPGHKVSTLKGKHLQRLAINSFLL